MGHSTFNLVGHIDHKSTQQIKRYFRSHCEDELHDIYIKSNGGKYNEAIEIGTIIATYPTRGIAQQAKSSAFLVLQCCTERIGKKDSEFLLHFPRFKDGQKNFSHLRTFHNFLIFLSEKTGHTVKFLWELAAKEQTLFVEDALKLNFIDRILS